MRKNFFWLRNLFPFDEDTDSSFENPTRAAISRVCSKREAVARLYDVSSNESYNEVETSYESLPFFPCNDQPMAKWWSFHSETEDEGTKVLFCKSLNLTSDDDMSDVEPAKAKKRTFSQRVGIRAVTKPNKKHKLLDPRDASAKTLPMTASSKGCFRGRSNSSIILRQKVSTTSSMNSKRPRSTSPQKSAAEAFKMKRRPSYIRKLMAQGTYIQDDVSQYSRIFSSIARRFESTLSTGSSHGSQEILKSSCQPFRHNFNKRAIPEENQLEKRVICVRKLLIRSRVSEIFGNDSDKGVVASLKHINPNYCESGGECKDEQISAKHGDNDESKNKVYKPCLIPYSYAEYIAPNSAPLSSNNPSRISQSTNFDLPNSRHSSASSKDDPLIKTLINHKPGGSDVCGSQVQHPCSSLTRPLVLSVEDISNTPNCTYGEEEKDGIIKESISQISVSDQENNDIGFSEKFVENESDIKLVSLQEKRKQINKKLKSELNWNKVSSVSRTGGKPISIKSLTSDRSTLLNSPNNKMVTSTGKPNKKPASPDLSKRSSGILAPVKEDALPIDTTDEKKEENVITDLENENDNTVQVSTQTVDAKPNQKPKSITEEQETEKKTETRFHRENNKDLSTTALRKSIRRNQEANQFVSTRSNSRSSSTQPKLDQFPKSAIYVKKTLPKRSTVSKSSVNSPSSTGTESKLNTASGSQDEPRPPTRRHMNPSSARHTPTVPRMNLTLQNCTARSAEIKCTLAKHLDIAENVQTNSSSSANIAQISTPLTVRSISHPLRNLSLDQIRERRQKVANRNGTKTSQTNRAKSIPKNSTARMSNEPTENVCPAPEEVSNPISS